MDKLRHLPAEAQDMYKAEQELLNRNEPIATSEIPLRKLKTGFSNIEGWAMLLEEESVWSNETKRSGYIQAIKKASQEGRESIVSIANSGREQKIEPIPEILLHQIELVEQAQSIARHLGTPLPDTRDRDDMSLNETSERLTFNESGLTIHYSLMWATTDEGDFVTRITNVRLADMPVLTVRQRDREGGEVGKTAVNLYVAGDWEAILDALAKRAAEKQQEKSS